MKLLFDLQALQNGSRNRGIGRYVKSLFEALGRRDDIELMALLNSAMADTLGPVADFAAGFVGQDRVLVFPGLSSTSDQFPGNKSRRILSEAAYEAFIAEAGVDVLLIGSVFEGFADDTTLSLAAPEAAYLKAAVLYDLIPLTDPQKHLARKYAESWYNNRLLHMDAADTLLAISEYSAKEGVELLQKPNAQVAVISTAVDNGLFFPTPEESGEVRDKFGLHKPFLMHASVIDPRKNFDGLVKAYAALPQAVRLRHQLLLVGMVAPDAEAYLREIASQEGIPASDLVITGHVSDQDLLGLYRACRLFVFPSHYEGFGLPALEAMACGCPAIGSNITSVPEVIGDPAYTFDPNNTAEISGLMQRLLTDEQAWNAARHHAERHAATFSWDKVGERAVAALRNNIAKRKTAPQTAYPSARRMVEHVGARVELAACADGDLKALACALAEAEDRLVAFRAAAVPKDGPSWRIEGAPFDTTYSLALVNRETARGLAKIGWNVALQSGEGGEDCAVDADFLTANPDLAAMHQRAKHEQQTDSFAASRLNYPPRVADLAAPINALHHYAWEETGFPHHWVDDFNRDLSMMTTLARHVEKIMIDNGVSVPLVTSGCGVDHWERITADDSYRVEARSFRFLHVSSCFPRKGIDALLEAYGAAFTIDDDVSLIIKTFDNPHNEVRAMLADLQARHPQYPHVVTIFGDISDAELKALYAQCHVMVGPSFAEGYGLPFAEAMLSGIPVITTNWGGQLDFCNAGNSWLVDYRFERAASHLGVRSSAWARVEVQALVTAMRTARETGPETRAAMAARGRKQLLARHKWTDVARRLTAAAATLAVAPRREPKIGWISTWHSKCGIATYSQHLIEAMPGNVTVFSPENEARILGPDESLRLWRQSKSLSHLGRILANPASDEVDLFVIQFNFGFFNHADLANFIYQAKERGKSVVICLHATYLINLAPRENFQLPYIGPALAACDRILVHSIDDLNNLKAIGLVDNVALFPHGVLRRKVAPGSRRKNGETTIATYGFAVPHKGLMEALEAVKLLRDQGRKIRLKMVNAEYPAEVSAALVHDLKVRVAELGLTDHVEMHNQFLTDAESMELLTDTDLVVFPYQHTEESASGAVRYGMAVERPVAVTPLPIFGDLDGCVHRLPGTSPVDLARGIAAALDSIAANSAEAQAIAEEAERWRVQHDYAVIGNRLYNMCKAITNRQVAQVGDGRGVVRRA